MTSGFDELSLALFTTLAPAGTIAFIALALARLLERDHEAAVRIDRLTALPFSVIIISEEFRIMHSRLKISIFSAGIRTALPPASRTDNDIRGDEAPEQRMFHAPEQKL